MKRNDFGFVQGRKMMEIEEAAKRLFSFEEGAIVGDVGDIEALKAA